MKSSLFTSVLKNYFSDSFRRNAAYLLLANGLAAIFGFAFWIVAARFYSTEEVGLASALISAMTWLTFLSRLGFDWGLIRFLPKGQNKAIIINTCYTIASLVVILSVAVFVLGVNLWAPKLAFIRQNWLYIGLCLAFTFSSTINALQGQVFIAFRATKYTFIQNLILGVRLLSVASLAFMGALGIFTSMTIANVLAVVAGIFFLWAVYPGYHHKPGININAFKEMFSFSGGNYLSAMIGTLPFFMMPLILIEVLNPESSAYFVVAQSLSLVIGIFVTSSSTSLLAESSHDPESFKIQFLKALKLSSLQVPAAVLLVIIFGKYILSIYGPDYVENSLWLLWILAVDYIPMTINNMYYTTMRIQLKMRSVIINQIWVILMLIGLSYPLLKLMGLNGVGIAFLVSHTISALVTGTILYKNSGISLKGIILSLRNKLAFFD